MGKACLCRLHRLLEALETMDPFETPREGTSNLFLQALARRAGQSCALQILRWLQREASSEISTLAVAAASSGHSRYGVFTARSYSSMRSTGCGSQEAAAGRSATSPILPLQVSTDAALQSAAWLYLSAPASHALKSPGYLGQVAELI